MDELFLDNESKYLAHDLELSFRILVEEVVLIQQIVHDASIDFSVFLATAFLELVHCFNQALWSGLPNECVL